MANVQANELHFYCCPSSHLQMIIEDLLQWYNLRASTHVYTAILILCFDIKRDDTSIKKFINEEGGKSVPNCLYLCSSHVFLQIYKTKELHVIKMYVTETE